MSSDIDLLERAMAAHQPAIDAAEARALRAATEKDPATLTRIAEIVGRACREVAGIDAARPLAQPAQATAQHEAIEVVWVPIDDAVKEVLQPTVLWSQAEGRTLGRWNSYESRWDEYSTKGRAYRELHPTHYLSNIPAPPGTAPAPTPPATLYAGDRVAEIAKALGMESRPLTGTDADDRPSLLNVGGMPVR